MAEPPPKKPPVSTSAKNEQIATLVSTDDSILSRDVQAKIGTQLRTMYDKPVEQGVPERFTHLLKELEGLAAAERAEPVAPTTATAPTGLPDVESPDARFDRENGT